MLYNKYHPAWSGSSYTRKSSPQPQLHKQTHPKTLLQNRIRRGTRTGDDRGPLAPVLEGMIEFVSFVIRGVVSVPLIVVD